MKYILIMFICSQVAGNDCKPFQPDYTEFKSYSECARYGYEHSSALMTNFSDAFIEDYQTYIIFNCREIAET